MGLVTQRCRSALRFPADHSIISGGSTISGTDEGEHTVLHSLLRELGGALRGIAAAVRARKGIFAAAAAAVFVMDIGVPPVLLSLTRKPVDYFTFNPWLVKLPDYLISGPGLLGQRLEKIWDLALFWFSSDNPYGVEWGFAVTVADLARFLLMSLLVGAYFALWIHRRDQSEGAGWALRAGGQSGMLGAFSSVFGLATGGCTVMGCGAPVIPVVGLAFVGLSSGTLKWMSELSTLGTAVVLVGMASGVLYLGWRVGSPRVSLAPLGGWSWRQKRLQGKRSSGEWEEVSPPPSEFPSDP